MAGRLDGARRDPIVHAAGVYLSRCGGSLPNLANLEDTGSARNRRKTAAGAMGKGGRSASSSQGVARIKYEDVELHRRGNQFIITHYRPVSQACAQLPHSCRLPSLSLQMRSRA